LLLQIDVLVICFYIAVTEWFNVLAEIELISGHSELVIYPAVPVVADHLFQQFFFIWIASEESQLAQSVVIVAL
jgi:hypothetical protein